MDDDVKVLKRIYDRFNARDIDGVLAVLTDDVAWANGMDGGHVHGARGSARILDAPVDPGQSAHRACELSSNCGWRHHCRSPADRPRSGARCKYGALTRAL